VSADQSDRGSKAWTVFAPWNDGIIGSNPTQVMDVCLRLFCVFVVLSVCSGIATGWSPVQGVLPTVKDQETQKATIDIYVAHEEENVFCIRNESFQIPDPDIS
jgi:hypothetical protein